MFLLSFSESEEETGVGVREEEHEERKWKTKWKKRKEGGPAPCCLSLNTPRRTPSFSFFKHTSTVPNRRMRVLLQLNLRSVEPRLRGRQREDSSLHERYPLKTGEKGGMRGEVAAERMK